MKNPSSILLHRMSGLVSFILIVILLNLLIGSSSGDLIVNILNMLNANLLIIIIIALVMMTGEILLAMPFPLNLPGPVFSATGSMLMVAFLFSLVNFMDLIIGSDVFIQIEFLAPFFIVLTFAVVLLKGYYDIFACEQRDDAKEEKDILSMKRKFVRSMDELSASIKNEDKKEIQKDIIKAKRKFVKTMDKASGKVQRRRKR